MRPASSGVTATWISVFCLLATLISLAGQAPAQAAVRSKHKLSQSPPASRHRAASVAVARPATWNAPPPLTPDNWTGSGGDSNWGTSANWSAGVPNSTDAVTIGTTTANVNMNVAGSFGSLTLSGTGDSLNVLDNQTLTADGSISNTGSISLSSGGNTTQLVIGVSNVTLSGTGTVTMGNNPSNRIIGNASADTLTNSSTIQGAGQIGAGQMTLVNSGTIDANAGAGQNVLFINTSGGTTNTGTLEATNGSTLSLDGSTFSNTGGTVKAVGSGSVVNLQSGVTVTGGTLTTSSGGVIQTVSGDSATLSGLTNSGTVNVHDNSTLTLVGTINNTGTIQLNSGGNTTNLEISGNVTLSGSGTVVMGNNPNNIIRGASGAGTEILTSANTVEGAGNIGDGIMGLVNTGTVNANAGAGQNTLYIDVSSAGFNNKGTIEATNGSTLVVTGPANSFVNYSSGTNTLTSGTYIANSGNVYVPLGSSGGIVTLSANVTEESGGQILNSNNGNANALNGLTSITSTGALTIGGVAFADSGNFSNAGALTILGGESFSVGSLTQISGGSLTAGTYVLDSNLNLTGTAQTITTNAATLTLGGGTIENTSNSTNALAGLAFNTKNLTIAGTSNAVSTTAASFSNTGTLTINGSDSFTAGNLTQISSGKLTAGTYVLGGNLNLTTTGISITTNSATLTLQGGTINSNGVNALSALASNTKTLTIAGTSNAISTTATSFSNTGTLTINSGDSFTASKLTQISGTTLTAGTYVLSGNLDLTTSGINITTNSATLTLSGGTIKSNGVNTLSALASNTKSLTIAGTDNNISTTASSFSNTVTLTINSGDSFTAPALTQISGSTLTAGTYVLAGNLDLTATANITTNSANLTLEGGSIKTGSTNDLANLATNTNSVTLASNASFTAAGNFTNSGALTINKGSTFTLTGSHTLTNLSGGTLASGTYTIGGTLQLTSTNGGIATNAANLTLTGTAAKINDGSSNALASLNNNTGSLTLSSSATLTTASSNFTNSGTVVVSKGTTLTVGGTGNSYNQSAGTTTVDGTLVGAGATGISVTGGTIQGAGTLKTNVSIGGSGTAPTINIGDAGKAGLLSITGTYTQLSSGAMNVSIGGTTVGTQYSQLKVTGSASLGGTLSAALVNGFTPTIGQTFTILTASSISGTFTNSTIAINSSEHFAISYTSTGVILTVASGPASNSNTTQPAARVTAVATRKPALGTLTPVAGTSMLRHRVGGGVTKPVLVASAQNSADRHVFPGSSGLISLRLWERIPVTPSWDHTGGVAVARATGSVSQNPAHSDLARPVNNWQAQNLAIPVRAPLSGWIGASNPRRLPVRVFTPPLPRVR